MKRKSTSLYAGGVTLLALLMALMFADGFARQPYSYYQYLTNYETTVFNEIIWFWTPDTVWGPLHSNDYIGLKYSPQFYGPVSSSKDQFRYYQPQNIFFRYQPESGVPVIPFPRVFTEGREQGRVFGNPGDGMQSRLVLEGNSALNYRWRRGSPFSDTLQAEEYPLADNPPVWFFDEPLELKGVLEGQLTIGCSYDIFLIDDIRYAGANRYTGYFIPDEMESILGLVSERNIIIKNTRENGRENGLDVERNNFDRHSIAINGALLAMNSSFTFEDQNDDWDLYQGPTPDHRGHVYLCGSVAQYRRGYLHRSNHQNTGYGRAYRYDDRLLEQKPPLFPEIPTPAIIGGSGTRLTLRANRSPYELGASGRGYDTLFIEAGVEITIPDTMTLAINSYLEINGTAESPVVFIRTGASQTDAVRALGKAKVRYAQLGEGVIFNFSSNDQARDSLRVENCNFGREQLRLTPGRVAMFDSCRIDADLNFTARDFHIYNSELNGNWEMTTSRGKEFRIENSIARGNMEVTGDGLNTLSYSVFEGMSEYSIPNGDLHVTNCNFINTGGIGLRINAIGYGRVLNSIFAYNTFGIVVGDNISVMQLYIDYSAFWSNSAANTVNYQLFYTNVFDDPQFVDAENGDYHLQEGSPCIDAGHYASPLDPDGSRADIGAFPFDHRVAGVQPKDKPVLPDRFGVTASPNPFNTRTVLNVAMPGSGNIDIVIYDIRGREVLSRHALLRAGVTSLPLIGNDLGGSGVYVGQVRAEGSTRTVKMVYLP